MKRLFLPMLLALAVSAHASDLAAEARKLQLAYAQKLDELLAKAKSTGDTAAAKEIEGMIAQVEGKKVEASAGKDLLAGLVGVWRNEGSVWKFNDEKGGVVSGKHAFTMSYDSEKRRVIVVGDNWINYLTFTANADLMNGSYEKDGRSARFKLTRVK